MDGSQCRIEQLSDLPIRLNPSPFANVNKHPFSIKDIAKPSAT